MDLSNYQNSPAHNEFRSDTFTTPTVSMIQSLATATLGDAVYDEDEATKKLEQKVADIAGKQAGLYCVSGTLSNQIALRVNLHQPPYSIMCDYRSHIFVHEAGGIATLSQAMSQTIIPKNNHHLTLQDDIIPNFIPDDGEIHSAPTKVISLENTLHGMVFPLDEIIKISKFCKAQDVKLHLDGARIWNANVATGISIKEYCSYFDSVSLCLSKTIGAPIGSVLVGDFQFIKKANHFRKQNGGGIRQSGLLASMAITAIDENWQQLKRTHDTASEIGDLCLQRGIVLEHPVETNFVFIDVQANKFNTHFFEQKAQEHGVKASSGRLAFHYQQSPQAIEAIKKVLLETWEEAKKNPFVPQKDPYGYEQVERFYTRLNEKK